MKESTWLTQCQPNMRLLLDQKVYHSQHMVAREESNTWNPQSMGLVSESHGCEMDHMSIKGMKGYGLKQAKHTLNTSFGPIVSLS